MYLAENLDAYTSLRLLVIDYREDRLLAKNGACAIVEGVI